MKQESHQNPNQPNSIPLSAQLISSFFSDYHLEESQNLLWQLFKLAFSENWASLSVIEKENLTTFYEQLDALLVAVYCKDAYENQGKQE
ncbi:hypothetical protein [Pedobacter nutrimenti]|uniref:Uncharacterized protein n=1 Tax=Pedobacter nutrimenti TaxID=1241337 RepID=A0A318UBQ1_9SPHI|nr:hypothetical protein [Pedobacter nutrimenti]PYF72985.1 hypothetical protein B0O44_105360 [Pedobacter nutrimenti]|eukprot:gene18591-22245_t